MTRQTFTTLPPAQQAGILCNDPKFQEYVGRHCLRLGWDVSPGAAAQYLRDICRVTSRRDLNASDGARQRFEALRTDFDAWAGRLARPPEAHGVTL